MSKRRPSRTLQKGDRVRLITWAPMPASTASFPFAWDARFGDTGTILLASNGLDFGGSHVVRWDKGSTSGAVRGCWLERAEEGREMNDPGPIHKLGSEPVVEDLDEAVRRRELTDRLTTAAQVREGARAEAFRAMEKHNAEAEAAYEEAIVRAWDLYDKGRA